MTTPVTPNTSTLLSPSPELVRQWCREAESEHNPTVTCSLVCLLAIKAARWGADQELEACVEWAAQFNYDDYRYQDELRSNRRPKPLSLKEQALQALYRFDDPEGHDGLGLKAIEDDFDLIRRALEQLDD